MTATQARNVRAIIVLTAALSVYTLMWRMLIDRSGRFLADATEWHGVLGGRPSALIVVGACAALSAAIVLAQSTRGVNSAKGAIAIGLLIAIVALPASIGFGVSAGLSGYVALRSVLLLIGMIGTSLAAVALRR
jgi:hypothetical protein